MSRHSDLFVPSCISWSLLAALLWSSVSFSAQILHDSKSGGVKLVGELVAGDERLLRDDLERMLPRSPIVLIDSAGGDLDEAMLIGRLIRERDLMVYLEEGDRCYSSCVLVLAAGVSRAVKGSVGIHRPYFAVVDARTDVQAGYRRMVESLRAYLLEMNVPESLADLMMSVPPEKMHLLDRSEIGLYFPDSDPIFDEIRTSKQAAHIGISNLELRKRRAAAKLKCTNPRELEFVRVSGDGEVGMELESAISRMFCEESILWGRSLAEHIKHQEAVNATFCSSTDTNETETCWRVALPGTNPSP